MRRRRRPARSAGGPHHLAALPRQGCSRDGFQVGGAQGAGWLDPVDLPGMRRIQQDAPGDDALGQAGHRGEGRPLGADDV